MNDGQAIIEVRELRKIYRVGDVDVAALRYRVGMVMQKPTSTPKSPRCCRESTARPARPTWCRSHRSP